MGGQTLKARRILVIKAKPQVGNGADTQPVFLQADRAGHLQPKGFGAGDNPVAFPVLGQHLRLDLDQLRLRKVGVHVPGLVFHPPFQQLLDLLHGFPGGAGVRGGAVSIPHQGGGVSARSIGPDQDREIEGSHRSGK